jgi:DNA-binding response OmpR family regulator
MEKTKILLVEDDINLSFVIRDNLEHSGFSVTLAEDGEQGLEYFMQGKYELCILDVMLPKKDGFTLAREIRQKDQWVPVLFLTAKSLKEDKIEGFKTGADDFITKPFNIDELILRINVFLRRSGKNSSQGISHDVSIGQIRFSYKNQTLTTGSSVISLTLKEAELLQFFIENKANVVRREEILLRLWGDDDYFMGRSLDVFISRLRKYLASDSTISIVNVHGVGFKLIEEK